MKGLLSLGIALAVIAFAVALGSCAGPIATGASQQRAVYQAESAFADALPAVSLYDHLPDCGTELPAAPCSEAKVRAKVNAAARAARASLDTAEQLVRANSAAAQVTTAVAAASQDVAALTALAKALGQ